MTEPEGRGEGCARCAIAATMARYHLAGDRGQFEGLADTFTPDGELDTGFWQAQGRDQIIAQLRQSMTAPDPRMRTVRHHLTTSDIRFEADGSARGLSYFMVLTNLGPDHSGSYADHFVEQDGQWLIGKRKMRLDWIAPTTLLVREKV